MKVIDSFESYKINCTAFKILFVIIKNGLWDATNLVKVSFHLIFGAIASYFYQDSNGKLHYLKSL